MQKIHQARTFTIKAIASTSLALFLCVQTFGVNSIAFTRPDVHEPESVGATISVNTLEDASTNNGNCSLREAITAADTNAMVDGCPAGSGSQLDTITFSVNGTILLSTPLPDILSAGPVLIDGTNAITISGNNQVNILTVQTNAQLTLENITLSQAGGQHEQGGALTNLGGVVTLSNVSLVDNQAVYGGGIYNNGTLSIDQSNFTNNKSTLDGGALYNLKSAQITGSQFIGNTAEDLSDQIYSGGGAIDNDASSSSLHVAFSQFQDNSAEVCGAILNYGYAMVNESQLTTNTASAQGGAFCNYVGKLEVYNSTVTSNQSADSGGGIYNSVGSMVIYQSRFEGNTSKAFGGAISSSHGNLRVTNSYLLNNTATDTNGGAIWMFDDVYGVFNTSTFAGNHAGNSGGAISASGLEEGLFVTNSTFSQNSAKYGSAIDTDSFGYISFSTFVDNPYTTAGTGVIYSSYYQVELTNTILSNSDPSLQNCYPAWRMIDRGYNIDSGNSCNFSNASNSMTNTNPLLTALADHGGPTLTYDLQPGSPAINAGDPAGCFYFYGLVAFEDQRGFIRPWGNNGSGGPVCDIGAVEYGSVPPIKVQLPFVTR